MKNKRSNPGKERNVWKIVSLVFIALFIFILAWGLMNTRPVQRFTEPTQEQIDMAKSIVAQDLQSIGDSIGNYEAVVTNRIVGFIGGSYMGNGRSGPKPMQCPEGMCRLSNLQVSLLGNSTNYLYLVDIDSGKILMRSLTKWFNE